MYQFSYAEVSSESSATARDREREALDRTVDALQRAQAAGPKSREAIEAIYLTRSLWSVLVEDLANPENALPEELRAALISIGLWIMREAEAIRLGRSDDFSAMIEITAMIRDGLGE
ncbi:flagellar biosynthesis regulator FlaF [Aureimonas sp. Leaf324]|jgi:flagellar protein FlaF|uniref:flagellar biosynthesis regulator FlaF n=1 Tax=Aureimonas sp. Leaf324 TaxID=1736336 RepID=UPI0006FD1FFB|nr:flagellar biosynthesis regulator FlaF [Aureimonas sp. Leaf324]KQQ88238.1 flagellar biosynthesis regulator FlhF [Aureimonas sp. Leaf324]